MDRRPDSDALPSRPNSEITGRSSRWPGGAPFALFLSHDIDEIYHREFFRFLGDCNHLRRVVFSGEPGDSSLCTRRIASAAFCPDRPGLDVETILDIERNAHFRSTFFLLEDRVFSRKGGRYYYSEPATRSIAKSIENRGCEIAVHGAFYNRNDPEMYRAQVRSFQSAFGTVPVGIRNHELRHDGVPTWMTQSEAGFLYDASFGFNDRIGSRLGLHHPFFPLRDGEAGGKDFVALPMTIMDNVLFWCLRLSPELALEECLRVAESTIRASGVLCLNWHNNYFRDPEYRTWQDLYEKLLGWISGLRPWNATGAEIARWWIDRCAIDP